MSLKNFGFLVPHLPEFEGELKDLLFEIDKLIERKKHEWENELKNLEQKLLQKVKENQVLHETISVKERELAKAFNQLNSMNPKLESNEAKEMQQLKLTVDRVTRDYDSLREKYRKQVLLNKEKSARSVKRVEEDNLSLLTELQSLREEHTVQLEMLKQQLIDEKNMSANLQSRCDKLQSQFDCALGELDRERKKALDAQLTFMNRQSELETLLKTAHCTAESQAKELAHVKQVLTTNQAQLRRLSSEASAKQSELRASKDIVKKLEAAVARHLAVVNASSPPSPTSSSPGVSPTQTSNSIYPEHFEGKLVKLERQLNGAHKILREKLQECSRLEATCRTASTTIQRLVDVKNQAMRQAASLAIALGQTTETVSALHEQVDLMDQNCTHKLQAIQQRLTKLKEQVAKLTKLQSKCYTSTSTQSELYVSHVDNATQTDPNLTTPPHFWPASKVQLLRNDWMASIQQLHGKIEALTQERDDLRIRLEHQISFVERLQKENLALTDVLTGAENFNRTRISCATQPIVSAQSNLTVCTHLPSDLAEQQHQQQSELPSFHSSVQSVSFGSPIINELEPNRSFDLPTNSNFPAAASTHSDLPSVTDLVHPFSANEPLYLGQFPRTTNVSYSGLQANLEGSTHPPLSADQVAVVQTEPPTPNSNRCQSRGSSVSMSPSEYGDFLLHEKPNSRRSLNKLDSDFESAPTEATLFRKYTPPGTGLQQTTKPLPVPAHSGSSKRILPHQAKVSISECHHQLPAIPSSTRPNLTQITNLRTTCEETTRQPKVLPTEQLDQHQFNPQVYSTARKETLNSRERLHSDQEDDDTSVYCLAAKFLASEQQHSVMLESRIDAHIEALKKHIGLCSS